MLHIGNGTVLTLDKQGTVIKQGGVVVEDDRIIALGKTAELRIKYPLAKYKDVKGKIIMPGMINTHMHLYSTFARGMDLKTEQPPRNFTEILEKLWWRLDAGLNEKDIYYSALAAVIDGLKKGTTTIFDHHASFGCIDGSLDIISDVVENTGIRANLAFEISDRHGQGKARASIRENERFIKSIKSRQQNYLSAAIGLHASFTLEEKTLQTAAALAEETGVPFHLHTAEGRADVEDSQVRGFSGVVERLNKYQIWRPGTLAVHGVHLGEDELAVLKEKGCYLVHNPESNMGNAVGAAPLQQAFAAGLTVGLGTDGYTADMFESIKVANLLIKHQQQNPQAGWEEVARMAFEHNRQIAGQFFGRELGVLKFGAAADIIVIDYLPPTPLYKQNVYSHILFGMEGSMVETAVVGGRMLVEDREVKVLDVQQVMGKVIEQSEDFWKRF